MEKNTELMVFGDDTKIILFYIHIITEEVKLIFIAKRDVPFTLEVELQHQTHSIQISHISHHILFHDNYSILYYQNLSDEESSNIFNKLYRLHINKNSIDKPHNVIHGYCIKKKNGKSRFA